MLRNLPILVLLLVAAACQPNTTTPFAATLPVASNPTSVARDVTPVPTANPIASRTATLPPTATYTPSHTPTITPSPTLTLTPTDTLTPTITPTPVPISSATPTDPANDPNNTPVPSWTPPPADTSTEIDDHYVFSRPIADGGANWVARTYPYGNTSGGALQTHLGVDMENPSGTPILAAANGVVFYAGPDDTTQFGPQTNYYGNVVVIKHAVTTADGQPVFTLYGHMQRVEVQTGATVEKGDQIGVVGATGVAFGPHLHFEVRVGDAYDFHSTRNPELWIFPYRGYGTLVGLVTDANGARLYDVTLQVKSAEFSRYAFSYHDDLVNPDSVFQENFTLGDIPANYYEVTVSDNGRVRFRQIVYVYANRSTWVDVKLK